MDQNSLHDKRIVKEYIIPEATLQIGDVVYKVVLDTIVTCKINSCVKIINEHGNPDLLYAGESQIERYPNRYRGYSGRIGTAFPYGATVKESAIGINVFSDKREAEKYAEEHRNKYMVIRAEEMIPEEVIGIRKIKANGEIEESFVAMLKGNMIYEHFENEHCPFLTKCTSAEEMKKRVKTIIQRRVSNPRSTSKYEYVDITPVFEDVYYTKRKKWTCYEIADYYGPVIVDKEEP